MTVASLTGLTFGNGVVIGRLGSQKAHSFWALKCACGNFYSATNSDLKTSHTKSCGCLKHRLKWVCIRGHDITLCGRSPSGNCNVCVLEDRRSQSTKDRRQCNQMKMKEYSKNYYLSHQEELNWSRQVWYHTTAMGATSHVRRRLKNR